MTSVSGVLHLAAAQLPPWSPTSACQAESFMLSIENWKQSLFKGETRRLVLDFSLSEGGLKSDNLVFLMDSAMGIVCPTSRSVTKICHCCWPTLVPRATLRGVAEHHVGSGRPQW